MNFKVLFGFVLIVTLAALADSAATKVECYDKDTNHHWPAGTEYRPVGKCVTISCDAKGNKSALTCALSVGGPDCKKVDGNIRKSYPECCPTFRCKKN